MMPRSISAKRTSQSPASVSAMPTGSPISASLRKIRLRLAEEDQVAAPADLAPAADLTHDVIGIVPGLLGLVGIGSRRWPVAACRRHLAERFVRPMVVEIIAETVEAGLLLGRRGGGRARGLRLERGMHALVTAILLPRAGLDALPTDAQLEPMHRKPSQNARADQERTRLEFSHV